MIGLLQVAERRIAGRHRRVETGRRMGDSHSLCSICCTADQLFCGIRIDLMSTLLPTAPTLAKIVKTCGKDCQASNHASKFFGAIRTLQAPEDFHQCEVVVALAQQS